MAILENLLQGLDRAAGADDAAASIEQRKQHRQNLSDVELQTQTQQILGDVQALNERRAKLDPSSPTYQKDSQTIDQALHDARKVFTDLYHPQNNPGALGKLGGWIDFHIRGKKQQPATTPAQARQSMSERIASIDSAAYTPTAPVNPYTQQAKQIREAFPNLTPEQVEQAVGVTKADKPQHQSDYAQGLRRFVEAEGGDPDNPTAAQEDAYRKKRAEGNRAPKDRYGWIKKNGKIYSVKLDANNQVIKGSENSEIIPPAAISGRITEGYYHFVDDNGNVHQVKETRTSMPAGGGTSTPQKTTPKTPAEAKSSVPPPSDSVIGHRLTAPQTAAKKKYDEAVGLVRTAEEVAQHPDQAINQKRLAVQLERLSAGRFTTQALDYVIKSGWGNTIQQWANNPTTGALPQNIVDQLVQGAKEYRDGAAAELEASGMQAPGSDIEDIIKALKPK